MGEARNRARQFADNAYKAALGRCSGEFQKELLGIGRKAAARGVLTTGGTSIEIAQAHGRYISNLVQARLEGLLEGYELHNVALDDPLSTEIAEDVMRLQEGLLTDSGRAADQTSNAAARTIGREQFAQQVRSECMASRASIEVEIQRWRFASKKESAVTNVYHVHGHNPRWNTNSTDSSVNIVSSEEIFSTLRLKVSSQVPASEEQRDILEKLRLLEETQNSPAFAKRYSDFIGSAANHMALIAPFIPALTEMMHKLL